MTGPLNLPGARQPWPFEVAVGVVGDDGDIKIISLGLVRGLDVGGMRVFYAVGPPGVALASPLQGGLRPCPPAEWLTVPDDLTVHVVAADSYGVERFVALRPLAQTNN